MRKILKYAGYKLEECGDVKNRKTNNVDCFLCIVYAIISLVNAVMGMNSLKLVVWNATGQAKMNINSIKTILLILVNAIVLIRLNIKLYVEGKDKELDIEKEMDEGQKDLLTIKIETLDKRIQMIYHCYVVDLVIFIINVCFLKNGIESSISILIILPIVITLYNNLIDIGKRKYNVGEKVSYGLSSLEGVTIHGNNNN